MQALNNWGLVLQELSTMGSERERPGLVAASVARFRRAIRLRPEFDRACYNLGTVCYSHAHALQAASQSALSSQLTKAGPLLGCPGLSPSEPDATGSNPSSLPHHCQACGLL